MDNPVQAVLEVVATRAGEIKKAYDGEITIAQARARVWQETPELKDAYRKAQRQQRKDEERIAKAAEAGKVETVSSMVEKAVDKRAAWLSVQPSPELWNMSKAQRRNLARQSDEGRLLTALARSDLADREWSTVQKSGGEHAEAFRTIDLWIGLV